AVRYRRQPVAALEPQQAWRDVGPCVESVPREREVMHHLLGRLDAEARGNAFEVAPVQHVELAERDTAGAHLVHGRLVLAAPGIREGEPVERQAERLERDLGLARDARAPVDQRPEYVEEQRLRRRMRGCAHEPAGSMPLSFMAATAFGSLNALISALAT